MKIRFSSDKFIKEYKMANKLLRKNLIDRVESGCTILSVPKTPFTTSDSNFYIALLENKFKTRKCKAFIKEYISD